MPASIIRVLTNIEAQQRPAVWTDIETRFDAFQTAERFVGPCELLVASGSK